MGFDSVSLPGMLQIEVLPTGLLSAFSSEAPPGI